MAITFNAPDTNILDAYTSLCDYDADVFKITLHNGYSFDSAHDTFSDVSGSEIATGSGYTQQTKQLASVTVGQTGGTFVFDAGNVIWVASGGTIGPATDSWVYDDTSTGDRLIFNLDFGASESAPDGSEFQINWNASGIFTGAFS